MSASSPSGLGSRSPRREAGSAMIELMMAMAVLAIGLMGHLSSSVSASRYGGMTRSRSDALRFAEQFVERLRSDPDWPTLYTRLNALQRSANATAGGAAVAGTVIPVSSLPVLNNGRRALPATAYYSDFEEPANVDAVGVLVEIPGASSHPLTPPALHEDANAPIYGLPADLNGDGAVDSDPHNGDYIALPILVRFRFLLDGDLPYEFTMPTWLRGVQ